MAFVPPGLGWQLDLPDLRDYSWRDPKVVKILRALTASRSSDWRRLRRVDLREFFPDIRNQQQINSSSAHAAAAMVEYFGRRAHGKITPVSVLYLYKSARKLMRASGNIGVNLRMVLKALVRFGVPTEYDWPYDVSGFDKEPDPFLHSYGDKYRSMVYLRLDQRNSTGTQTLKVVKAFLAAGFPVVFGFPVPTSLSDEGDVPYRPMRDSYHGGQAAVAVGYDDERIRTSKGALLVRNSWGEEWGEAGYGWLPYGFVEQHLATDFWTVLKPDWVESAQFNRPRLPYSKSKPAVGTSAVERKLRPR